MYESRYKGQINMRRKTKLLQFGLGGAAPIDISFIYFPGFNIHNCTTCTSVFIHSLPVFFRCSNVRLDPTAESAAFREAWFPQPSGSSHLEFCFGALSVVVRLSSVPFGPRACGCSCRPLAKGVVAVTAAARHGSSHGSVSPASRRLLQPRFCCRQSHCCPS